MSAARLRQPALQHPRSDQRREREEPETGMDILRRTVQGTRCRPRREQNHVRDTPLPNILYALDLTELGGPLKWKSIDANSGALSWQFKGGAGPDGKLYAAVLSGEAAHSSVLAWCSSRGALLPRCWKATTEGGVPVRLSVSRITVFRDGRAWADTDGQSEEAEAQSGLEHRAARGKGRCRTAPSHVSPPTAAAQKAR
jgi:hypothetical protein